jgi:hypothetical protein
MHQLHRYFHSLHASEEALISTRACSKKVLYDMAGGLAGWWDNLAPTQQQSVIVAAVFLALTWAIGGLLIYAIRDANRKLDAKKAAGTSGEEVSCPVKGRF